MGGGGGGESPDVFFLIIKKKKEKKKGPDDFISQELTTSRGPAVMFGKPECVSEYFSFFFSLSHSVCVSGNE